jgi:DNA-binding NarL/FixJ family response regulator
MGPARYDWGMPTPMRVLLAEADGPARNALALLLKSKLGLQDIGEVVDGAVLARTMAACPPGLLLLDWSLPERPAPEVLRQYSREIPGLHLVILSVDGAHRAEAQAIDAEFIYKGSPAEVVLEQLRALVETA